MGFAGEVNTNGGVRNYQKEALVNIQKQSLNLSKIIFKRGSTPYNKLNIIPNSIIYCDIPYFGTTKYKDDFDHAEFWEWCRIKVQQGHKVFISEYNAPK